MRTFCMLYLHCAYCMLFCRLLALRDGRELPTELSSPSLRPSLSVGSSPVVAAASPVGAESPYERELRLRREAEERLRAKFGTGGLKGQAVSNGFGSTPEEPPAHEYVLLRCCLVYLFVTC